MGSTAPQGGAGLKIVIAGASGFIGKALIPLLLEKFPGCEIIALSRTAGYSSQSGVSVVACDLFSPRAIEQALPTRVDLAIYLVHSMSPTAALDQGSFADYDLILADNFARTLQKNQVKHLIYLGGLLPQSDQLSRHLQSRLEVEQTFRQYHLPLTVFRAGLIFGAEGASAQILFKLVRRLPWMICPRWTQTETTPVDLDTVLLAITDAALKSDTLEKVYDLAGCEAISYLEMMKETAKVLGKSRYFIPFPFFTPTLSRLWVSLITQTSRALVYPLVESLEHPMVARRDHLYGAPAQLGLFAQMLAKSVLRDKTHEAPSQRHDRKFFRPTRKTVRSIQRISLPAGLNAVDIRHAYMAWISRVLSPWISVHLMGDRIQFRLFSLRVVLLELEFSGERSTPDRQVLYIRSGLLVSRENQGRLEFRRVLGEQFVLAAIHEFRPALPWYIYKYSQAIVHLLIMKAFARRIQAAQ